MILRGKFIKTRKKGIVCGQELMGALFIQKGRLYIYVKKMMSKRNEKKEKKKERINEKKSL